MSETPKDYTEPAADEKLYALLVHLLSAFAAPFVTPLVSYFLFQQRGGFAFRQAREGLNFQLTVILVSVALAITIVGILVLWIYLIFAWVMLLVAAFNVFQGREFRFPLTIRFIK